MKNKIFVPVPVSERLPAEEKYYTTNQGTAYFDKDEKSFHTPLLGEYTITYWLEEREDRTAELVEMLKGLVSDVDNLLGDYDIEWQQAGYLAEAKLLITSIEKGENNG